MQASPHEKWCADDHHRYPAGRGHRAGQTPDEDPTDGPLLQVTDLKTNFTSDRGRVQAVDGVTFTLERGKTLGIVGESGSGKSVLLAPSWG